jgi:MFS family permease
VTEPAGSGMAPAPQSALPESLIPASMPKRIIVPLIIACALFMENMDATVITTALPAIAADLGVDPISLKLALTAYLLSLAVFIPISGWMADRFGALTIFRAAIVVFTLGSAACGFAQGLGDLVAYRIVQGLGGAMMVPVGRLVILRTVPKHELVQALTWLIIPALLGPCSARRSAASSPPIFIGAGFSGSIFRSEFSGCCSRRAILRTSARSNPPPLDKLGFVLSGIGLTGLAFGFTIFGQSLLPPLAAIPLLLVGAGIHLCVCPPCARAQEPADESEAPEGAHLPGKRHWRISVPHRHRRNGISAAAPFSRSDSACPVRVGHPHLLGRGGRHDLRPTVPFILRRFGFRRVILFNGLIASFFIATPAFFTAETPYAVIAAVILAGGFFRALQFSSVNSLAFADLDSKQMSQATSITSVAQQLAIAAGVAVAASVSRHHAHVRGDLTLIAADFAPAFVFVGVVAMCSVFLFIGLPKNAGAALTAREEIAKTAREPDA